MTPYHVVDGYVCLNKHIMYYNTTNLRGDDLNTAIHLAKSQEEKILLYWQAQPDAIATPEHFAKMPPFHGVPITSIRRAFSGLCKDDRIRKTGNMTYGQYGRAINTWRLISK